MRASVGLFFFVSFLVFVGACIFPTVCVGSIIRAGMKAKKEIEDLNARRMA